MAKFVISQSLFEKFPQLKVGVLILKGYDNSSVDSSVLEKTKKEEENIRSELQKDKLSELEAIKVWREAYSSFGAKPKKYKASVEGLLRRVLEGESLPSISNLVNIYNYISIKYRLPLGADDLGKLSSDVRLTYAKGDEQFIAIGSDEKKSPDEGEIVYKSENDILCRRWNWREADLSKIDGHSKNIIVYCESLLSDGSVLESAMKELQELLGGKIAYLDAKSNAIDIDSVKTSSDDFSEFYGKEKKEPEKKEKKEKKREKNPKKENSSAPMHWADQTARRIIEQKGEKEQYVCASGITPSGVVHIGNFREIITVDLVVRGLRSLNKKVRFIYSWDDYDVFRKVPKGFPKQKELEKELRKPIVDVFDPFDEHESFARHNEIAVEEKLPKLGIHPEFIYQNKQYRSCAYTAGIQKALENADVIQEILNEHRKEPLDKSWIPLSLFDPDTKTDEITELTYEGGTSVSYKDKNGDKKTFDFSADGRSKLLWRVDWPMRWAHEKVDFEPGGKDHSTVGGSFTTGKEIARKVYNWDAPLYIMYDFISIKGAGGKISSSLGNVITLKEVLEIYEPEIVRYLFAGTRPNAEFAISFDVDVIKIYEDFDKCERIYYGKGEVSEKERIKQKRIYELSSVDIPAKSIPYQPSFRHLTTIAQICEGNIGKAKEHYSSELKTERDHKRFETRFACVMNWLEKYAPEEMKFSVVEKIAGEFTDDEKKILSSLREKLQEKKFSPEDLHNELYAVMKSSSIDSQAFFSTCYRALINKEKGPKLASFIVSIGQEKVVKILESIN